MADKIQRQVQSIAKAGSARLKGDVTLTGGTNVTLTQSGNDISIASSGGGGGSVASVVAGNNIDVDATDPANPVVAVETLTLADVSDVTASVTEVNYTDGVTSAIQTQLDGKSGTAHTHLLAAGATDVTATSTELNYVDGVTSAIQTQLDGKQPLDSDLTTIAGLTATTDNFMVATASAWASRTPSQARTQLGLGTLATQDGTFSGTSSGTNTGDQTISDATITTTDITTNDVSITKHGFAPKAPNDSSKFLNGVGSWAVPAGSGDMVLASVQTVTGAKTFGTIGGAVGKLILAGSTSGSTILDASAVAGTTTVTLPAATDTLVGKATTDTLTNKTLTTPTIAQINNSSAPGVKLQLNTQTDNSNSISSATTAGLYIQTGWGQFAGNGTATQTETVTFPTAFTTVYSLQVTFVGATAADSTAATSITDLEVASGTIWGRAHGISTTNAVMGLGTSGTFASTRFYAYSWTAIGA